MRTIRHGGLILFQVFLLYLFITIIISYGKEKNTFNFRNGGKRHQRMGGGGIESH